MYNQSFIKKCLRLYYIIIRQTQDADIFNNFKIGFVYRNPPTALTFDFCFLIGIVVVNRYEPVLAEPAEFY